MNTTITQQEECSECGQAIPESHECWLMATPVCESCFLEMENQS